MITKAIFIWGMSVVFYFYELMLLVTPSVMTDDLVRSFAISAEQLGSLSACYYYAYALMQIPVGLWMDRYGPRILLVMAAMLCSMGCLIFAAAQGLWIAMCGRFVMGVGGAFAVVGSLKLASLLFPPSRFALLTGVMVAAGMMGGVFGQAPVAKAVMIYGWRATILGGAGIGGVLSLIMSFIIRYPTREIASPPFWESLKRVMSTPQGWIISLYAGLMFVPTTGLGQLWGVPYFRVRFDLEKDAAGWIVSMIFFGWAIGGPLYGWVSDKIQRRKLPMGFAALTTLVVILWMLYVPLSQVEMEVAMFLLGFFSSGFILAFSMISELHPALLTGTVIGFINTLNNASGALAQPMIGTLLDLFWEGKRVEDGMPFYSLSMYHNAFLFLPICILIALLIVPFIRETFCRNVAEEDLPKRK